MKKLILVTAMSFCLNLSVAKAATSPEVDEYYRVTDLGNSALRSKNYDSAFKYLEQASKLGNKVSQFTVALLYMEGLGVEQDYTQAYLWLNVASETNVKKWRTVRDQIQGTLTTEQIAALTPMINDYIEKYGAKTQEVSCYKKAAIGTNRKLMQCSKYRTPWLLNSIVHQHKSLP